MKAKLTKTITAIFLFAIPVSGFGQVAPDLNSAGDFGILAGTAITFDGTQTVINDMDVGLSPGFLSSITGNFVVNNGKIIAADSPDPAPADLLQAKKDLEDAYGDAAGQAPTEPHITDNQGGKTLDPGVYKSPDTSLSIEGEPLYLDAKGNPDAVWIFQIGSTLKTTIGGDVILINGAQAKNVYWQVGTSATLGSGTVFKGNILAYTSITIGTGAVLDGRALAKHGAVTFAGGGTMTNPDDVPADLTITKKANKKTFSEVGDVIEYEIVVENIGTETVTNITVVDELIGLDETIASLAVGGTVTNTGIYTITFADVDNGFVKNTATAEADGISVSAFEVVIKEGLLITKVATPKKTYYAVGQVIDYEIIVENTGTETVTFTVYDVLTDETWSNKTLGPGKSQIFETSYPINDDDMSLGYVDNTATATVSETIVTDTERVLRVNPPPPVPLTTWAIVLGGILIAGFVIFQYKRSTPKRV